MSEETFSKRPVGRPPHEYDEVIAGQLKLAITFGIPQAAYEQFIGNDVDTLRKHYPDIFASCKENPDLAVKWRLFKSCMDGNVTALIFWAKMRIPDFKENNKVDPLEVMKQEILDELSSKLPD